MKMNEILMGLKTTWGWANYVPLSPVALQPTDNHWSMKTIYIWLWKN